MRKLFAIEAILIVCLAFLGLIWPSIYTLLIVIFFPALLTAIAFVIWPKLFQDKDRRQVRPLLQSYVHLGGVAAFAAIAYQGWWMLTTHTKHPVDFIFDGNAAGPYRIVFPVEGGQKENYVNGRRVYEFGTQRILLLATGHDGGWWYEGERRFFRGSENGLIEISARMSRGQGAHSNCTYAFEDYTIGETENDSLYQFIDDNENWGVVCENGKLKKKSTFD